MTNEEFQNIVLEELKGINGKLDKLEERQEKLEKGQDEIKRDLKAVIEQTADLTEFRHETINILDDMRSTISRIEIATAENWIDIAKLKSVK